MNNKHQIDRDHSTNNCNTNHRTIDVPALGTIEQQVDFLNKIRSDDIFYRNEEAKRRKSINIVDEVMVELSRNQSRCLSVSDHNFTTLQNIYEKFHSEEVFGTMRRQEIVKIMAELIDFGHKYLE